jgi:predicted esterase
VQTGVYTDTLPVDEALGPDHSPEYDEAFVRDARIVFRLYVPKTYDPSRPAGIVAYVSPSRSGAIPNAWRRVIGERNLIWVSVDKSGNDSTILRRMAETLAAVNYVRNRYHTDEGRVFVAGFSGGGRLASILAYTHAGLFRGALYICGANAFPGNDPLTIARMRQNRFVFLSGTKDFNRKGTEAVHRAYETAGITGIRLMIKHNLAHELPGAREFDNAMDWLDTENSVTPD